MLGENRRDELVQRRRVRTPHRPAILFSQPEIYANGFGSERLDGILHDCRSINDRIFQGMNAGRPINF
jgi:hypothetical protein